MYWIKTNIGNVLIHKKKNDILKLGFLQILLSPILYWTEIILPWNHKIPK